MRRSPRSLSGGPSVNSFPFASLNEMEVIESSGRSENQNRIKGGELVTLDPEAGSLRFRRACAHAGAGPRTSTSTRANRGALLIIGFHFYDGEY
jgi:hypothetical protein